MSGQIKIGVLSGSMNADSMNLKLANYVVQRLVEDGGVETQEINLLTLGLPVFSPELGLPDSVADLKDQMISCDALVVASPEYNGSLTGALKNAIDWASVPRDGDESLACFKGKACGLLAASPGAMGGLQGLGHVRQILTRLQMHVVPTEFALGKGHEAFDEAGNIKDDTSARMAVNVGREMIRVCRALSVAD